MSHTPSKNLLLAYCCLGVVCILWGTTFFSIRIGVQHMPPLLFAALRQFGGAILLLTATWAISKPAWPDKKYLANQAVAGFLLITVSNGTVSWSEVHVSSGLAAILCSLIPLYTVIINFFFNPDEKPNSYIIGGMLICAAGIVLIFSEYLTDFANPDYRMGIIVIVLGNFGWAFGSLFIKKRIQTGNPFMHSGFQMLFGGMWLIFFSLLFDSYQTITWNTESVGALIYLILFGSVAAYSAYTYAMKKLPLTIVSLYAYINPIIAVLLGWWFLEEKMSLKIVISSMITLSGIYLVNWGYQKRKLLKTEWSK